MIAVYSKAYGRVVYAMNISDARAINEFDESKHPRQEDGKFGSGGSSGISKEDSDAFDKYEKQKRKDWKAEEKSLSKPTKKMSRKDVLDAIRLAGTKGDNAEYTRLYLEHKISFQAAKDAFSEGYRMRKKAN